jgi:hypothetical protein
MFLFINRRFEIYFACQVVMGRSVRSKANFQKMKVGLSNHLSVCVSPTNNFWLGGNVIQGDLDAVIFNAIL